MSDDNGADTTSGNGSGKKDKRPELSPADLIVVAVLLALITKLIEQLSKK